MEEARKSKNRKKGLQWCEKLYQSARRFPARRFPFVCLQKTSAAAREE
jgi:hypothetical protein